MVAFSSPKRARCENIARPVRPGAVLLDRPYCLRRGGCQCSSRARPIVFQRGVCGITSPRRRAGQVGFGWIRARDACGRTLIRLILRQGTGLLCRKPGPRVDASPFGQGDLCSSESHLTGRDELQRAQGDLQIGSVRLEVVQSLSDALLELRGVGPRGAVGGDLVEGGAGHLDWSMGG